MARIVASNLLGSLLEPQHQGWWGPVNYLCAMEMICQLMGFYGILMGFNGIL